MILWGGKTIDTANRFMAAKVWSKGKNQLQRKNTREFLGNGTILCQVSGGRYVTLSDECTMKSEYYCM